MNHPDGHRTLASKPASLRGRRRTTRSARFRTSRGKGSPRLPWPVRWPGSSSGRSSGHRGPADAGTGSLTPRSCGKSVETRAMAARSATRARPRCSPVVAGHSPKGRAPPPLRRAAMFCALWPRPCCGGDPTGAGTVDDGASLPSVQDLVGMESAKATLRGSVLLRRSGVGAVHPVAVRRSSSAGRGPARQRHRPDAARPDLGSSKPGHPPMTCPRLQSGRTTLAHQRLHARRPPVLVERECRRGVGWN